MFVKTACGAAGVMAFALLLIFVCAQRNAAAEENIPSAADSQKYMFINEIKPGMKGYGLTVFSGTTIEKFDAEIISVLYGTDPQSNLILARVSGGPIETAGVIAGMSGSPIYIDGRIIGALAYSWAFQKEAVAGITPIEEMLRIFSFEEQDDTATGLRQAQGGADGWAQARDFSFTFPTAATGAADIRPIMTPIIFSGFSQESVEFFRPQLAACGIVPVVGGSFPASMAAEDAPFEEGAAVGVQLVRGDMSASAIGTLTVREGDRVLAFGHPFMLSGSVDLPMTTAYVHTVLASLVISSKVGSALTSVGTLTQDRRTGVAGVMGGSPDMVPVSLCVARSGEDSARSFGFEIARTRQLLPALTVMALASSFGQVASSSGPFSAKVRYDIELDGFPVIHNEDFVSGLSGFPPLASLGLFKDLTMLLTNQFEELSIKDISMEVEVQEAVESAQITGARIRKQTLRPGEDIELKVIMKPYMKDSIERRFVLTIPEQFPEGQAFVQISAAPETAFFEMLRSPFSLQATSIKKLIELVDRDYPGNRLDIRVMVTDPGIVINGQEMAALPSSVFSVMSQTIGREPIGISRASVLLEEHIPLDFEINGSLMIPITIDRRAR